MRLRFVAAALLMAAAVPAAAGAALKAGANVNVDLDHGLAFPQNKQNEPSITRDPATPDRKSSFADHEWIAVDTSASSPWFGRIQLFWADYCNNCSGNGRVKLYVTHSSDEGRTWSPGVQVSGAAFNLVQGQTETGQIAVSSDGTVEAFWTDHADSKGKYPSTQVAAVSKDGGATFTNPIPVAGVSDYPLTGTPFDVVDLFNRVPGMSARVDCYPHPASDPSSTRVYVVW